MPDTDRQYIRDPQTGALVTVANVASDKRLEPPAKPAVLRPAIAGVLGLLTALAAAPGAMMAGYLAGGVPPPPWLISAAAIGGGLSGILAAGAYWAAGGSPLELLARFAPKVLPAGAAAPSDGAPASSSDAASRRGPPES